MVECSQKIVIYKPLLVAETRAVANLAARTSLTYPRQEEESKGVNKHALSEMMYSQILSNITHWKTHRMEIVL
jgi:hypothetical protein